ncbi:MAG: hypothetical protein QNJ00_06180 [Woeseiaceae bacterium]|nr:hypothetical protein [Woeseiaceae bacterium]
MHKKLTHSIVAILAACLTSTAVADDKKDCDKDARWVPVSGTGIHYFSTAIVHSERTKPNGKVQRSTETIDLSGDLEGRVLYQPRSRFDFVAGTLVNTGRQVFSGTVLGSKPVLIYDDEFRFEVNLNTGATVGKVFLVDRIAGPRVKCEIEIIGTGFTPEGDGLATYSGRCKVRDR